MQADPPTAATGMSIHWRVGDGNCIEPLPAFPLSVPKEEVT
jgi:hypothetical protein